MRKILKRLLCTISPELTTRLMYLYNFKKPLNLRNPSNFNEKLQYLKLKTYYNNPVITQCVDKYRVRSYLEDRGYADMIPKLLGGPYTRAEELCADWDQLPDKFVIKCNHGCGYNILVSDKSAVDLDAVEKQLDQWMKEDFWKEYCEPQYRFVPRRIHVEEHLGEGIQSYKFYCIHQQPEMFYISSNGENGEKDLYLDYYNMDWEWQPITLQGHKHVKDKIQKPENFEKMVTLAKELSAGFPFVRIDLYNVDGRIYLSEFTFIPTGGNMKLNTPEILEEWGRKLQV